MALPEMTPIDIVLADLGMMVRRARVMSLTPIEAVTICKRMMANLPATGADPHHLLNARLGLIVRGTEDESLTFGQFTEITNSIRVRLIEHRPMPVVPNFAVLPYGVHGREVRHLTVIDGGRTQTPDHTLKGA